MGRLKSNNSSLFLEMDESKEYRKSKRKSWQVKLYLNKIFPGTIISQKYKRHLIDVHNHYSGSKDVRSADYVHQAELFGKRKREEFIPSHENVDIDNQVDDPNKDVKQNVVINECSFHKKSEEDTCDNKDIKQ